MTSTQLINLRLPKKMLKDLDKIATIEFENRTTIIRRAINEYLKGKDL